SVSQTDTSEGPRARLDMTCIPNARYVVQYRESDFSFASKWIEVDSVSSSTTSLQWQDTRPLVGKRFYRFRLPTLQVFRVIAVPQFTPDVSGYLNNGGVVIVLDGQCLVDGMTITLTSPGLAPITLPVTLLDSSHGQAFAASLADGI